MTEYKCIFFFQNNADNSYRLRCCTYVKKFHKCAKSQTITVWHRCFFKFFLGGRRWTFMGITVWLSAPWNLNHLQEYNQNIIFAPIPISSALLTGFALIIPYTQLAESHRGRRTSQNHRWKQYVCFLCKLWQRSRLQWCAPGSGG